MDVLTRCIPLAFTSTAEGSTTLCAHGCMPLSPQVVPRGSCTLRRRVSACSCCRPCCWHRVTVGGASRGEVGSDGVVCIFAGRRHALSQTGCHQEGAEEGRGYLPVVCPPCFLPLRCLVARREARRARCCMRAAVVATGTLPAHFKDAR